MVTVARVLLDSPLPQLDRLFDYAVPADLVGQIAPGQRVKVPLRTAGRIVEAWVIEVADTPAPPRPLSDVDAIVSSVAVLPASLYALARRVADRAAGSASDVLRLAIPKRMVRAEKAWLAAGPPPVPVVAPDASAWARGLLDEFPGTAERVAAGERLALDAPPGPAPRRAGESRPSADVPGADATGADVAGDEAARGDASGGDASAASITTTVPVGAWAELVAALALLTLESGRSALIVLPDHRDQTQIQAALAGRVPDDAVVRDDARQSGPDRYAAFLRLLDPVPCIVVGNRSTVYAPAHDVGTVIVWDDGDPLLAEPLSPGVHARDAALVRQELEGSALVFAGHTRTSDVERLVQLGWVREAQASRRRSPRVVLSGVREGEARGQRVPSAAFAAAREALTHGPVLVQVARPGYAPVLVCAACRAPARCPHCAGPLRARRPGAAPDCGWCGRTVPNWACAECAAQKLRMASSGSERTADELGRAFPHTRVIVADGEHPVAQVDARPALVIATRGAEPVAADGYRAVILLDGDRMLVNEQLRIGESCLRWWSNAAALAAPGAPVHLVGVEGPVARAFATWTQPAYARTELAARAPLLMPPTVRVAAVEGTAGAVATTLRELREAVPALHPLAVLGPVPIDDGFVRALIRFDYSAGRAVADHLRAAVVSEALRGRRASAGKGRTGRTTLRVRLDVPEPDL